MLFFRRWICPEVMRTIHRNPHHYSSQHRHHHSLPSNSWVILMTYLMLILSSNLIMRVGPLIDGTNGQYLGTQLLTLDYSGLFWMEDGHFVLPRPQKSEGLSSLSPEQKYSVVIDAGSTGTRVQVFVFNVSSSDKLILDQTYFRQIKPGLSSYASEPENASSSLEPLMDLVKSVVPTSKTSSTPLMVKATAGLRLLSETTADIILQGVRSFLTSQYSFRMDTESVSILDGDSEGIYAWMTINYLLEKFMSPKETVSVLDLGGGSTQVTFSPSTDLIPYSEDYLIKKRIDGMEIPLYTHSYLGFGLMSARKSILKNGAESLKVMSDGQKVIRHPCFTSGHDTLWEFEGIQYNISSAPGNCYKAVSDFVSGTSDNKRVIDNPGELNHRPLYAISYYYDRAVDSGIISEADIINNSNNQKRPIQIKVRDFLRAAKKECRHQDEKINYDLVNSRYLRKRVIRSVQLIQNSLNQVSVDPFMCLDLTYITVLLHEGFGLDWNKNLNVINRLKGVETSWALGAAYDIFQPSS